MIYGLVAAGMFSARGGASSRRKVPDYKIRLRTKKRYERRNNSRHLEPPVRNHMTLGKYFLNYFKIF